MKIPADIAPVSAKPPVKKNHKRGMYVLMALLILTSAALAWWYYQSRNGDYLIPDEKVAAEALLAQKFTGPRYFQLDPVTAETKAGSENDPYIISPYSAGQQVERVVRERHLGPDIAAKLQALIDRLTEPPQSRVSGGERVNILRLNLALDALQ